MKYDIQFFSRRNIVALLLILLAISMAFNMYQYVTMIKRSNRYDGGIFFMKHIQGGMGQMSVYISKELFLYPNYEFNVSIGITLWEPYAGPYTYGFIFTLYSRTLEGEYSDIPLVQKIVNVNKSKDEIYIDATSGSLTAKIPTYGIYVFRVVIEGSFSYAIEFPVWAEDAFMVALPDVWS